MASLVAQGGGATLNTNTATVASHQHWNALPSSLLGAKVVSTLGCVLPGRCRGNRVGGKSSI